MTVGRATLTRWQLLLLFCPISLKIVILAVRRPDFDCTGEIVRRYESDKFTELQAFLCDPALSCYFLFPDPEKGSFVHQINALPDALSSFPPNVLLCKSVAVSMDKNERLITFELEQLDSVMSSGFPRQ